MMQETFEDIVNEWYEKLREPFTRRLASKYPWMTFQQAEDIYQDIFVAIGKNLEEGKVKEDTAWASYITTIGYNIVSHHWRKASVTDYMSTVSDDGDERRDLLNKVEAILAKAGDEELPYYRDPEAQEILGNELQNIPSPCSTIVRMFYYENASMTEIAKATGLKNADTAKSKKSQCMKRLIQRVETAFKYAGIRVTAKKTNKKL